MPALAAGVAATACPTAWGYGAHEGPAFWGQMDPAWARCDTGRLQSPIAITDAVEDQTLPALAVNYDAATRYPVVVQNNGHEIKVTPLFDATLELDGVGTATLLQFHFHVPPEHQRPGVDAKGEVHFVHRGPDGKLIVVGALVSVGNANPAFDQLLELLPGKCQSKKSTPETQVAIRALLSARLDHYYAYQGSLTTPACDEGVSWIVLHDGITASAVQIERLRVAGVANARPLQPRLGRKVTFR
jgi:carbonic anhydrase